MAEFRIDVFFYANTVGRKRGRKMVQGRESEDHQQREHEAKRQFSAEEHEYSSL